MIGGVSGRLADLTERSPGVAVAAGVLLLSFPVILVAALQPNAWLFLAALLASYGADWYVKVRRPYLHRVLSRINLGLTVRFLFREFSLIVLLARQGDLGTASLIIAAVALIGLHALRGVESLLAAYIRVRRRLPVVTRNIDLSGLDIPAAPPRLLMVDQTWRLLHLDLIPMVVGPISAATAVYEPFAVALAASVTASIAATVVLARHAAANRSIPGDREILKYVGEQLTRDGPQVALYFSGSIDSAYQINMWLPTVAKLDRRAVVIMRERQLVTEIVPTTLPVVCLPSAVDLMGFNLAGVRVALYISNVGKNIHMLRIPGMKHVFIGHGDSDKQASFNPFSRVYDEVWVAGTAARERYARARVGVIDKAVVEVGRPQLDSIETARGGHGDGRFTVLYAPTWEGWTADLHHTSVVLMGPRIVQTLLEASPPVRIIYKPHPLTGSRDQRVARADSEIIAMIEAVNSRQRRLGRRDAGVAADLRRIEKELASLTALRNPDEAMTSRDSAGSGAELVERVDEAVRSWHQLYWASRPPGTHQVVVGSRPSLYECFNQADFLIADISSVVSDFIESQKPHAVTNSADLPEDQFRERYLTAAAAYILPPDCESLPDIIAKAAAGDDVLAERRRTLKSYLLGPDQPPSFDQFNAAVNRLAASATDGSATPEELEFAFDPEPGTGPSNRDGRLFD